jgi:glutathione S-transferase
MEQVDLFTGANRTPEAMGRNPYGGLPVLELDDGTCIAESVAIRRYFEDLHPEAHISRYFQHTSEIFKTRIKQLPEVAEVAREAALAQMRMIDGFIAGRRFIAGERYTIADITAMVALGLGAAVGLTVGPGLANLTRRYGEVSGRPSARA